MANSVKFIQIKKSGLGEYTQEEYLQKLEQAKLVPGAVIFGLYIKSGSNKTYYDLWANGQQYKLGSGTDFRVETGYEEPWYHTFTDLQRGDLYIKQNDLNETEYDDSDSSDDIVNEWTIDNQDLKRPTLGNDTIYNRTAYVFVGDDSSEKSDHSKWQALSGNVSAENVYFPKGVQRTIPFGVLEKEGDDVVIDGVNKNLRELLEYYLVKEVWPTPVPFRGALNTTDTFAVTDSGTTLTLKLNNSSGSLISSEDYIMYGNSIYAKNVYNPTLNLSASPEKFEYLNSKITGMTNGYGISVEGGKTSSDTFIQSIPNPIEVSVSDNESATRGTVTSTLKINNITLGSTTTVDNLGRTGDASVTVEATKTKPAIGSYTISVVNTNAAKWERSFSYNDSVDNESDSTGDSIITDTIDPVYYCSNKFNLDDDHSIGVQGKVFWLPETEVSCEESNTSKSFKIYYPIESNIRQEVDNKAVTTNLTNNADKIIGNSITLHWKTKWTQREQQFIFKIPNDYNVAHAWLDNSSNSSFSNQIDLKDNISTGTTFSKMLGNSESVTYKPLTTDWTFAVGAWCHITFTKS